MTWLLDLGNATIEAAELYQACPGSPPRLLARRDLWSALPHNSSIYENMLFHLPSGLERPCTFILRIESQSSLYLPMTVITPAVSRAKQSRTMLWYGFYYGILVVMFVTNLIFYARFRDRSRLYYLFFVAFTAVYFATRDSLTIEYLFRLRPYLDFYCGQISLGLVIIFTILFSKEFLKTGSFNRIVDHGLTFLAILSVLNIALIPFNNHLVTMNISTLLGLTVSVALLITGLMSLRSGFRPARYYLLSFVFFLSGAILYALNYAGILSYTLTTFQSFQVCSGLQVILLSIALSDQIAELQQQKELAQADTAQALDRADKLNIELQEYGRTLEQKVDERTRHLNQALTKVEELANTDVLTGLYNRRKFNELLTAALTRSRRYGRPLSVIIFDIDHFKRINDTYGHQIGDTVLQELAKTVAANIRSSDALARWGGEEFVIVACETGLSQAANLAEKIRQVVDTHPFTDVGHVTISLGVTTYTPHDSVDTLMIRVDKALYHAKSGGRNRVESA
jgi:diguanylate cyclase